MNPLARERLSRIGWLLTPLVVWAASFCGAWLGAVLAERWDAPVSDLALMGTGAIGASVIAVVLWMLLLRRRPRDVDR